MDTISDQLSCPVCLEVPSSSIFQCKNGHNICGDCSSTLDQCPECRVPYREGKVRNRGLERVIDSLKTDCPNKKNGCCERVLQETVEGHLSNCLYSGNKLKFCGTIGFTQCNHVSDCSQSEQIVDHLRTSHGVIVTDKTDVSVKLEDFKRWVDFHSKMENSKSVWGPFVLSMGALKILVLALFQGETKMFSWASVYLGSPSEFVGIEHKVKLSIKSTTKNQSEHLKVPDLSWEINTVSMLHVGKWFHLQPFQIPSQLLLDGYTGSDGSFKFKASLVELNHSSSSSSAFDWFSSFSLDSCVRFSNPVRAVTNPENETSVESSSSSAGLRSQRRSRERYHWIPASNGEIVSNPVPTSGWFSNIYFVVRAKVPGRDIMVPGYLYSNEAWISFNGQIHKMKNYEMLSIPVGTYEWSEWKDWGSRVPGGAVEGGNSENGVKYYVGQSGGGLVGRIDGQKCYEAGTWNERECDRFRYLLLK